MKIITGLVLIMILLLTGCASQTQPETLRTDNGSELQIESGYTEQDLFGNAGSDKTLRDESTHDAVSGLGVSILSHPLQGGVNPEDMMKNNFSWSGSDDKSEPSLSWLLPRAGKQIARWMQDNAPGYKYKEPLKITPTQWALIKDTPNDTTNRYALNYRILFYKLPENGGVMGTYVTVECKPIAEVAQLEVWQANNYKKVTEVTQRYMESCLKQLDTQLPVLLRK